MLCNTKHTIITKESHILQLEVAKQGGNGYDVLVTLLKSNFLLETSPLSLSS